jgi:streptogramin lyase
VRLPAVGSGSPRHFRLRVLRHPAGVTGIAAAAGYVWATLPEDHALWRIDPTTGQQRRFPLRYAPWGVTAADDGVWVTFRPRA